MDIIKIRNRVQELEGQRDWCMGQRAAALAQHAQGVGSARARVNEIDTQLRGIASDLDLERETLAYAVREIERSEHAQRRAAARKTAAEASALMKEHRRLAEALDVATVAWIAAMSASLAKANEASAMAKKAFSLAIPAHDQRNANVSHLILGADDGGPTFPAAAASALREAFRVMSAPHHAFQLPVGVVLPAGARLPFAEAAEWVSGVWAGSVVAAVERAVAAEEALIAEFAGSTTPIPATTTITPTSELA